MQRALVTGGVQLDGLGDDAGLFARPEGKAFLALFPAMAVSVDRLDEKIRAAKLELIKRQIEHDAGGAAGYFKSYSRAVSETQTQWQRYRKVPGAEEIEAESARRQDEAWRDYVTDIGKRGWTPSTIPNYARSKVVQSVQSRVPVSPQWNPADEQGFRAAVAGQVRRRTGDGSVTINGKKIAPGLDFSAFFAHPAIQAPLHERLLVPDGMQLQSSYASAADFTRRAFQPMLKEQAQLALLKHDAAEATFAAGGTNARDGIDAARAVIVPPVALFFSLLGAIGHLAKLCYLLSKIAAMAIPAVAQSLKQAWLVPLTVLAMLWTVLSIKDNAVTDSRLYAYMRDQVQHADGGKWTMYPLTNALHVVAVGQGYGYPVNEFIRTHVLQGITYGYVPKSRKP